MSSMDFDKSTQARSWLFSPETLMECREKALSKPRGLEGNARRVRKHASGFHNRRHSELSCEPASPQAQGMRGIQDRWFSSLPPSASLHEQESLVRFHSHHLRKLIGPTAIYRGLVRSSSVLATAIVLLRRFYLSNSVSDFCPRRMAAASAFLASKLEDCRVEILLLRRATEVIQDKARESGHYKYELNAVSLGEIEAGERELMEGVNYELRCHHPHQAIKVLTKDLMAYMSQRQKPDEMHSHAGGPDVMSPRGIWDNLDGDDQALYEKAIGVAHHALVFTDVPFLFPPGQIAFAAVSIASKRLQKERGHLVDYSWLDPNVREYLRDRFPSRDEQDLRDFEDHVIKIVHQIDRSAVHKRRTCVLSPVNGASADPNRAWDQKLQPRPMQPPLDSSPSKKRKDSPLPLCSTPIKRTGRDKSAFFDI